ncbi:hypothetical protein BIWAKO_04151 [Bosea sp. BIWAKO-01]|nr:hypothetical protein BIWAKO_04151 [Bosea sp. BIWAKO-01]
MPLLRLFVRPIRVGDHMCLTGGTAHFPARLRQFPSSRVA